MEAALAWFVRSQDGAHGSFDQGAFEAWLAADPAHPTAFARAKALWDRFDVVSEHAQGRRKRPSPDRRKFIVGAVSMGLAGGGAALVAGRPDLFADFRTGTGERLALTLPDGSRVELGSDSALSLADLPELRRVVLHRGQGFVEARVEAARPFSLVAGSVTARTPGGSFDVKRLGDSVTVTTMTRTVDVDADGYRELQVEPGWQARYDHSRPPLLTRADLPDVIAWRQDRIVFRDTPLRLVAAELERYRRGRIILLSDTIGDLSVTAAFDARRTRDALTTIGETLPIRVTEFTQLLTLIRPL
ncbi:FecR family protein [Methylobacterium sp. E-045]|uniref:FecR family protein n=1 Tax=Methylobacterium sp. E-045 TaxID=2836575 RepID=UPI001FBAE657|nr:FecR domain-containing protein [Methylobacterium sp. E-045]MCJ2129267.1 FecR domain-containing protein [Methylobacterium sp. E-045]